MLIYSDSIQSTFFLVGMPLLYGTACLLIMPLNGRGTTIYLNKNKISIIILELLEIGQLTAFQIQKFVVIYFKGN